MWRDPAHTRCVSLIVIILSCAYNVLIVNSDFIIDLKHSIKAGNIIDCVNREIPFKKNYTININDNEILFIVRDNKNNKSKNDKNTKSGFVEIDAEKYTVMLGLIDSHIHVIMNHQYKKEDKWVTNQKKEIILLNSAKNIFKLLKSGVTTARDCGAYG